MTTIHTTILVVEDNRDLCENLAEILAGRGFHATSALTARRALELVAESPPDVALLDLNLPDGRGMDVLAKIQARSPGSACVILTGNATLATAVEAVNHGAYAYLLKGGRTEEVIATVERAAEKVRLERERALLERELREERNFSRAVVSNAALGIVVVAPAGRVLELNRHMRELLEAAGAGGGRVGEAAELVRLGADEAARERLRAALAGEKPGRETFEVEVARDATGRRRIWRVSTSPVPREGGGFEAVVAAVIDVTTEKDLQGRIVESSRLAAIGEMAARVAHEIRNPLAGIAGAIRVLGRGVEGDPKREAFAKELLALIGRLNAFVEDLLVYARPLRIAKEELRIGDLVALVKTALAEHPVVRGVQVTVEDRLGRAFRGDRHHLAMALQNLILNGAQAMKGAGRLVIEGEPVEGGGARISVLDEGPGIPADVFPRLFEAFATTRVEGTGLGLSTTKRIVEAHGGTISASNRAGGGARLEMRLPP